MSRASIAVVLMGPTASGKTDLVLGLARALPIEVISVDSAQVYRDMDIGTAKPDAATRAACPHHLIDVCSPEDSYSAGRFRADASRLIREIFARGRTPVLAGGTMLYFKALREGLSELPVADPELRRAIDEAARARGWPALHAELAQLDPATAARLKPNDAQRIQRALEIIRLTGKPLADAFSRRPAQAVPVPLLSVALIPAERAWLHERIARRFEAMLAAGLVDEVVRLRRKYRLEAGLPSMRCVGYRQVWDHLEERYGLATLREKGVAATRQLAKRQLTWLRVTPRDAMLDPCDAGTPAKFIALVAAKLRS